MTEQGKRSWWRRALMVASNVVVPGVALLRLGERRAAVAFMALAMLLLPAFTIACPPSRAGGGRWFLLWFVAAVLASLVLVLWAGWTTFRISRARPAARHWWARWPALIGWSVLLLAATSGAGAWRERTQRNFYMPSSAMAPTLNPHDRMIADMRSGQALRRGDILLVRVDGRLWVKRLIAVGNDRVSVEDDAPVVNGERPVLVPGGRTEVTNGLSGVMRFERWRDGHGYATAVTNASTPFRNAAPLTVPPGMLFLLGDNRDNSADSRVPPDLGGLGLVSTDRIAGRAVARTWRYGQGLDGTLL